MKVTTETPKFTKAIAKEIALKSFCYVIDCVLGNSDSGYNAGTEGHEFHQNFEEDLEEMGINSTPKRVMSIDTEFTKMQNKLIKMINKNFDVY